MLGRRDHAVEQKDWDTYARLHTDDYTAKSIGPKPIVGGMTLGGDVDTNGFDLNTGVRHNSRHQPAAHDWVDMAG